MLGKIIKEIEWQIGKLQSIREKLLSAQKEADELGGMIAGKVDISSAPVSRDVKSKLMQKFQEGEIIAARSQVALEEHEKRQKKAPAVKKKGKTGRPKRAAAKLTDEERKVKQRAAYKKWYDKHHPKKGAEEPNGEAGRQAGRQAGREERT